MELDLQFHSKERSMPHTLPPASENPLDCHCQRCHENSTTRDVEHPGYHTPPIKCAQCNNPHWDTPLALTAKPGFHPFETLNYVTKRPPFQRKDGSWCLECFSSWAERRGFSLEDTLEMFKTKTYPLVKNAQSVESAK